MEFITDNGKIDAAKALYQISQTQNRKTSNFEFDDDSDATALLMEFYRQQMRHDEKDSEVLRSYAQKVIGWMKSNKPCLLLLGRVGCGKTTMLEAICRMIGYIYYSNISYERRGFQWDTAFQVEKWAQNDLERYESFKQCEWVAIDDIGAESTEVSNYGNIIYPIRDVLFYRYEHNKITIISTNLLPKDLTAKYGERIGDRLAEMSYVITINEPSYRIR